MHCFRTRKWCSPILIACTNSQGIKVQARPQKTIGDAETLSHRFHRVQIRGLASNMTRLKTDAQAEISTKVQTGACD